MIHISLFKSNLLYLSLLTCFEVIALDCVIIVTNADLLIYYQNGELLPNQL